jgi:prepilin-type N-terminal cleavage/methylation domain-containing protein
VPSDNHITRCPKPRGLTLIELLVATALASMLLVAVMSLLKTLAVKRKVLVEQTAMAPWQQSLEEQLRWDLTHARRFEFAAESLWLMGYAARDFATGVITHRRSEVVYRLVRLGERTWLLREETQPDMLSNGNRRRELVCCGLTTIAMEIPGEKDVPTHSGSMPGQFRLMLARDAVSPPAIDIYCCR